MPMPKTPMDEDCDPVARQHDIWIPGQRALVESEPVSHSMKNSSNGEFRSGVLATYLRHES